MKNYYEILEVNKSASPETISKVYKFLAKKYHPDANLDNSKAAEEKFKQISEAYKILSNEEKRKQYDLELENYESENSPKTVPLENFIKIRDYCTQLENTLKQYTSESANINSKNTYYSNTNTSQYQNQTNYNQNMEYENRAKEQAEQQAYQDAINRAYHDAYVNNLRSMGYKIKYKKTFKEQMKSFLALIISAIVLYLLFKLIWLVPVFKNWFLSLFEI